MKNMIFITHIFLTICLVFKYFELCNALNISGSLLAIDMNVIGGIYAKLGDFPHQVSLGVPWKLHFCGGSLITYDIVITAAHCIQLYYQPFMTAGGGHVDRHNLIKIKVIDVFIHPDYDSRTSDNDIAILKVESSFPKKKTIAPVVISKGTPMENVECNISGWGLTDINLDVLPQNLKKGKVLIHSDESCVKLYANVKLTYNPNISICAAAPNVDTCIGDSGGPLACGGVLYGITSWGKGCGEPDAPGVYVDVFRYTSWIDRTVKLIQSKNYDSSASVGKHNELIYLLIYYLCLLLNKTF